MREVLRWLTAGESHGRALVGILEGIPAGLPLLAEEINRDLKRRQQGFGRGRRMELENDRAEILSGVRHGRTLGSPISLVIWNRDWTNWSAVMDPEGEDSGLRRVTCPRPGHADLAGGAKYGHRDLRNVLERASARETAMRVALGAVARRFLAEFGVRVNSRVVQIGEIRSQLPVEPVEDWAARVEGSPVRCPDPGAERDMVEAITRAGEAGDTLGGVFEVVASGLPPGLGSYVQAGRRLDGRLAGAVMAIPAIKGVEVGLGYEAARLPGSKVHDDIRLSPGTGLTRGSNRAGGLEGGVTNGQPLVLRAAMKPIATLSRPLRSVDLGSQREAEAAVERSDVCAVPAAAVVGEAVVALELASAWLEKFGGDSLEEVRRNYLGYLEQIRDFPGFGEHR